MKVIASKIATVALCFGLFGTTAFAQQEDSKIKIRVEKNVNGEVQVIEKEIDAAGLSEEERNALIESIQDSLVGNVKGERRVKIMIDEDFDVHEMDEKKELKFEFHTDNDENVIIDRLHRYDDNSPQVHVYKHKKGSGSDWDNLEWELERLGNHLEKWGEELPGRIERNLPRFYAWTDNVFAEVPRSSSIRSLEVYPNKPDSEVINVRFYAPEEGDVSIVVLDTKGNAVAKKTAKAFKGEYVGQIELKKAENGTYFVIVSQGDDGQSRKVVID